MQDQPSPAHVTGQVSGPSRRDFLYVATAAFGAAAAVAAAVPLISQMEPDASTIAAGGPIDVDLKSTAPGQNTIVLWRSHPVYILRRPPAAIAALQSTQVVDLLADPYSQAAQQPPYTANWHRSIKPEFLILVGICTHLGCLPKCYPDQSATTPVSGWPGGYLCPCHGSKYDLAGRVFKGGPGAVQFAGATLSFRQRYNRADRRKSTGPDVRLQFDRADLIAFI